MKPLVIAGIICAALGAFILMRGMSVSSRHDVIRIGDVQASVQTQQAVPQWVGVAALAGGALMIGAGVRGKRA
jgi:hypothetical protein